MKKNVKFFVILLALLLCQGMFAACTGKGAPDTTGTDATDGNETPAVTGDEPEPVPPEVGIVPQWSDQSMNGMCLGLTGAYSRKLDIAQLIDLLKVMNVKCMRNWMHLTTVLADPNTAGTKNETRQKEWIKQLQEAGVTKIIGMSHYWFLPESIDTTGMDKNLARSAAPYRDTDEGSVYMEWLELYEQSWYTMAATFPEITFWEVGNEVNMNLYLHPLTYESRGETFSAEEKSEIVTDMLYYASRGIHRANPQAIVIFPGLAPVDGFQSMATFLNRVYTNIESGKYGSGTTDVNCYFQAVAWHGYVLKGEFTVDEWIAGNKLVYSVMEKHGDGNKKVFLTEFGFSDGGKHATDLEQAGYYEQIYARLNEMPFLDSIYPFRMIEDTNNPDQTEVYYGIFRVFSEKYFGAKEKAKVICRLYGGDVNGLDKYIGDNSVYKK